MEPGDQTIERARAGEPRALADLVRLFEEPVARFVVSRIGPGSEVEDVCQTVFVKALLGLPRLKSALAFEPWLWQLAGNACRDHLRRRRRHGRLFVPLLDGLDAVAAEAPVAGGADVEAALAAVGRLPEADRRLLGLLMEGPKSYQELARATRVSVVALKSRLFRAREKLRKIARAKGA